MQNTAIFLCVEWQSSTAEGPTTLTCCAAEFLDFRLLPLLSLGFMLRVLALAFGLIMSLITFNYNLAARLRQRIAAHLAGELPLPGDGHQKVNWKLWLSQRKRPVKALSYHGWHGCILLLHLALWVWSSADLIGRLTPTHRQGSTH